MTGLRELITVDDVRDQARDFCKEREWEKFHMPHSLCLALTGECGELSEIFQWKGQLDSLLFNSPNFKEVDPDLYKEHSITEQERIHIGEELSDVLIYSIRLSDVLNISLTSSLSCLLETYEKFSDELDNKYKKRFEDGEEGKTERTSLANEFYSFFINNNKEKFKQLIDPSPSSPSSSSPTSSPSLLLSSITNRLKSLPNFVLRNIDNGEFIIKKYIENFFPFFCFHSPRFLLYLINYHCGQINYIFLNSYHFFSSSFFSTSTLIASNLHVDPSIFSFTSDHIILLSYHLSSIWLLTASLGLMNSLELSTILQDKYRKNYAKYPADKVKGSSAKYNTYQN